MDTTLSFVKEAVSFLKNNSVDVLAALASVDTKQNLEECMSQEELHTKVDNMFNNVKTRIIGYLDVSKEILKNTIPKDPWGKEVWKEAIYPFVNQALESVLDFIGSLLVKIPAFFISLWNTIKNVFVWVTEKVGAFVAELLSTFKRIFEFSELLYLLM